ncbi:alpha/beta fold hydrolase [Companilactobacillus nodensis]|uniref:Alpha beta superfamily hydrolase n=1 Tax=Companilactobacillus nodensis DSM 19682 = JCM 14932 = NBRC 107160 TaxID=1423775 RepID=A0A0R1K7S0_9LACO|nr:alpha/beta hydrolase [Companilactobacillus nodensis]KRK79387.1 alpha beta superfamily hydrolase [Companilactobacillus nodensis DSM 19682 = JCM 14932 = NBRC 107160]
MKFLTDDKVELDYNIYGTGKPVILIAGFGGYQEIWQLQVDYLVKMNYQVITYDHRNHGASERTNTGLTMSRLITDLHELIDYLQLDEPLLIGHSMGASVCYGYLSRYDNVAAVMSVDQTVKMLNDMDWHYGFMNINTDNYRTETSQPADVHETLHGLNFRVMVKLNLAKNKYPFDRVANLPLLFDHVTKDWHETIQKSSHPIMLVAAKESPYYNSDFAKIVADENENVTSAVVDNSGHDIMAEVPDQFNQLLRHFVLSNRRYQS